MSPNASILSNNIGTVLVAEDEEAVKLLAACIIQAHGFTVLSAASESNANPVSP